MKKIELKNLTDVDFEIFSKDILSHILNLPVRTFKPYKDKGIDCYVLSDKKWIGQSKFYNETTDSTMISRLKEESIKVKKLKPERYFLFISKELTYPKFKEIIEIFSPYLKPEDLYDEIRIQGLINKKEAEYILDKWDKLWLPTSPYFVEKFYEKFKKAKYKHEEAQIIKEAKIFVETENYIKAEEMLKQKNIILIHGEPGAGKTTLARRLALKYIYQGYELGYENASDLKDIEDYLYDERKKVIIIDDFLGQTTPELREISDNKLYNIIKYVKKSNNVKLILTTRTYIYNNAKQILEKFSNASERLDKLLIEVKKYSDVDKARILYNHLYYNGLLWSAEYIELIRKKYYINIIHNKNFTPRNIEQICEIIREDRPNNVIKCIDEFLNNPEKIWYHEYEKINESKNGKYEKILLDLIAFLKYEIPEEQLKIEFEKIVQNDENYYTETFYKCMEELSYAFVSSKIKDDKKIYKLANPGMEDFLRSKASKNTKKIKEYIKSIDKIEYLYDMYTTFEEEEINELIKERTEYIAENNKINSIEKIYMCTILGPNATIKQQKIISKNLEESFYNMSNEDASLILDILDYGSKNDFSYNYAIQLFKEIEIENPTTHYRLAFMLSDIFEWNTYLEICNRIFKRRNSKHLMDLANYMVDELITYVTDAGLDFIHDDIYGYMEKRKKGESLEKICDNYANSAFWKLGNITQSFTPEVVEKIEGIVMANHDAYIDEDTYYEYFGDINTTKNKESSQIQLEDLFEKDYEDQENLIDEYIINNILDENNQKQLIQQKNKWFYKEFFNNTEGTKILEKVINKQKIVPTNPIELGKIIIEEISHNSKFYKENKTKLELLAKTIMKSKDYLLDSENYVIRNSKEVIEQLKKDGIMKETEFGLRFINEFFEIYFLNKEENEIDEILEGPISIEYEVAIQNILSYKDIKEFNKTFIQSYLEYYTKYMRKQRKYTISKFLIEKTFPSINISLSKKYATIFMDDLFFQYIGIDVSGDLGKLKYYKLKDLLKEKYSEKAHYRYQINLEKVIKDKEITKEFDKTKIWDYFEDLYKKLVKLSNELKKDDTKDFYMYFNKKNSFEKYFDNDKRDNFEKYYL